MIQKDLLDKIQEAKDGKQHAFKYFLDYYWNDVDGFQLKMLND